MSWSSEERRKCTSLPSVLGRRLGHGRALLPRAREAPQRTELTRLLGGRICRGTEYPPKCTPSDERTTFERVSRTRRRRINGLFLQDTLDGSHIIIIGETVETRERRGDSLYTSLFKNETRARRGPSHRSATRSSTCARVSPSFPFLNQTLTPFFLFSFSSREKFLGLKGLGVGYGCFFLREKASRVCLFHHPVAGSLSRSSSLESSLFP